MRLLAGRRGRNALGLAVLTGGGFFLHTVTANVNEFRWDQVSSNLASTQALMPALLLGSLAFVVLGLRSRTASWWVTCSYLAGAAATALLVVLAVQLVIMVQASQAFYTGLQAGVISDRAGLARLESVVDGTRGPVLADEYAGLLPLDGRRIYLQPFEFSQLSREGKWNQRPLVEAVLRKEFGAILIFGPQWASGLVKDRWTPRMLQAIEAGYEPAGKHAGTTVYRPKQNR